MIKVSNCRYLLYCFCILAFFSITGCKAKQLAKDCATVVRTGSNFLDPGSLLDLRRRRRDIENLNKACTRIGENIQEYLDGSGSQEDESSPGQNGIALDPAFNEVVAILQNFFNQNEASDPAFSDGGLGVSQAGGPELSNGLGKCDSFGCVGDNVCESFRDRYGNQGQESCEECREALNICRQHNII